MFKQIIKISKLILKINEITSINPNIIKVKKHKADVLKTHGDNTKIKKYLNLKKFKDLFDELSAIIKWYEKKNFINFSFNRV